jgi:hypothetical protein
MWDTSVLQGTAQSKQSPIGRKFAQSGHPASCWEPKQCVAMASLRSSNVSRDQKIVRLNPARPCGKRKVHRLSSVCVASHYEKWLWLVGIEKIGQSGTDVMIYKILSLINLAKKMAFWIQNKAKLCKRLNITMVFEKNANFFRRKWPKSQKIVIITSTPGKHAFTYNRWKLKPIIWKSQLHRCGL